MRKTKYNNRIFNAFTLSELLLSLTIVGIIATLTVPVMITNFQKKLFATKVKNFAAEIEDLAQDELVKHRTRDLLNTDFEDPEKLLTDKHFSIVKTCPKASADDCWKLTTTGYKKLNKQSLPLSASSFNKTIVLKNGIMLSYTLQDNSGQTTGFIAFDVNGNDPPNIAGRDLFTLLLTHNGHVIDYGTVNSHTSEQKLTNCKSGVSPAGSCFGVLLNNNWVMDY